MDAPKSMGAGKVSAAQRNPVMAMEGAAIAASKAPPCTVTLMGFDNTDVLFRSDKVRTIQLRNGNGEIAALLVNLKGKIWGFSRKGDDDWNEVLAIYGNDDSGSSADR